MGASRLKPLTVKEVEKLTATCPPTIKLSLPTLPYLDYLRDTAHLGDTQAERVQKVRIGQDRFRDALLNYWNDTCPLTGIANPELLRASHIIPWTKCESDEERLNVHNGLLLSSLWDAAFDTGLVTFSDEGRVIASPALGEPARRRLGIDTAPRIILTDEHRGRLNWHRRELWQSG